MRSQPTIELLFPCIKCVIFLFLFLLSRFTHNTWLLILTSDFWVWLWCLAILLDVHRIGWICKFMYFIKLGKCLVITSSVSPQFILSPLYGTLITCVFYHLTLSNRFLRRYSFFLIFSPSSLCLNKVRNPRNTQEIIFIANGKQNVH